MPPSTTKRVILYRFDRMPLEGLVDPDAFPGQAGIQVLSVGGTLETIPHGDVKAVCFASSGGLDGTGRGDLFATSNLFFERRPKLAGLWTRFTFRDGDQLDGVLSHNLLEWPAGGYTITPPRAGSARQRVFIPRLALKATELRGVVGIAIPKKRKPAVKQPHEDPNQISMFEL